MYLGETPSAMKEFSVGVKPLARKSARNPSSDISIVVGANFDVPFERIERDSFAACVMGFALFL